MFNFLKCEFKKFYYINLIYINLYVQIKFFKRSSRRLKCEL